MRYYEEMMRSQRRSHDTFGIGYIKKLLFFKEGESSKSGEMIRNAKPKRSKPICYHCGKLGRTTIVCRSKSGKKNLKPTLNGYYYNFRKQVH